MTRQRRYIYWVLSSAVIVVLALVLGACGGGGSGSSNALQAGPDQPGNVIEPAAGLPVPVDVAPGLWAELQTELKRSLAEYGTAHAPSAAPTGDYNRVSDLQVSTNPDATATFAWHYRNTGDYNQDKAVTANDLTPVGQNYEQSVTDGVNDPRQQVVDGNADGWVTIHDITAIGQNFNKQVDGYLLEASPDEDTELGWEQVGMVGFNTGVLPADHGWLGFTLDLAAPVDGMYYRVAPYFEDPAQPGPPSAAVRFDLSAAGRPQNVTATQGTIAGGVLVAWSAMPEALHYGIWRAELEEGPYAKLGLTGAVEAEYLDGTAQPGIGYWYEVRANLLGGWSEPSDSAWGHAMAPPAAPEGLTATDGDYSDRIYLEWEPATGVDDYLVLRSNTSGGGYTQVGTSTAEQYDDLAAGPGTVYYYVVEARNAAGTSPPSNEAAGRQASAGTAPQVESVSPLTGEGGTTIEFSAVVSGGTPDTYSWHFGGAGLPNLSGSTAPSVWLALPDQYECRLVVANTFGSDRFDFSLTVTDPQLAPDLTAVSPLGGDSTGVYTFSATVEAGTPTEWEWNFGGGANPNTSTNAMPQVELGARGNYSAWVRATNGVGEDTYPFTLAVGDPPPPPYDQPGDVQASDGTSTLLITISWTKSAGATGYRVYRDSPAVPLASPGDVASWDDISLGDFQEHTYWVQATGPAGESDLSTGDTGYRRLPAPDGLTATDGDFTDRIRLRWNAVSEATGYRVYRDTALAQTLGAVLVWDDTGVGDFLAHSYTVRATNALSTSLDSGADTGYVGLAVPTGLAASDGDHAERIRLTWTKSSGATSYAVYRDSSLLQGIGDVATWDDTGVADHLQHTYELMAVNAQGSSGLSASDTGYRGLAAPTGLSASDGTQTDRISLGWTKSSGATGYDIYRDNQVTPLTSVGDIAAWDDTSVGDHASHEYWLKATNALSASAFSLSDTGFRRLSPPTGLSASDGTQTDRISLSWTQSTGATGYQVYRDSSLIQTVGDVASWDDTGVADFTQHTYELKAQNSLGSSDLSASDTGYRRVLAPANLQASDGDFRTKIRLTWDSVTAATGYRIYRDNQSSLIASVGAVVTWDDTTVSDYDTHSYWVRAIGPYSDGDLSDSDTGYRTVYAWRQHAIDATADVGEGSCLRVVNGLPMVSYRDTTNMNVKFARSVEATPDEASDWVVYTLDNSGNTGQYLTTQANLAGVSAVAYYDSNNPATTNPNLKIAIAGNGTPDAGDWSFHYVDEYLVNGRYPSMVVHDGRLAVAYQYFTSKDIKFARAAVALPTQASDWTVQTASSSGNLGNDGLCLSVHNSRFVIAYCKEPTGPQAHLAYAGVAEPARPTDWNVHYIEVGDLGQFPSITTWNGNLAVSYLDNDNSLVRFARATTDPPTADTDWIIMSVDTVNATGMFGSALTLDPDGYPGVAYHATAAADLLYAGTTDNGCDGPEDWSVAIVDDGASAGRWPSMTTVSGAPALAYQADGNLHYASFIPE